MEKEEKVLPEYEHPEVKDFGDLQELTNSTQAGIHSDLFLGQVVPTDGGHLDTFS